MVNAISEKYRTSILRQSLAAVLVVFLSVLPLILLAWIVEEGEPGSFLGAFYTVLTGQIFDHGWDPVHAGFTLDQPTIGKWFFWFTVFTAICLSYMELVRKFGVRSVKPRHWIFAVGLTALCLFLICLLTIPFWWLIQYIHAMGWTPKRLFGLFYGTGGYAIVLVFWYRAIILKRNICCSDSNA